ncbi:uncharacterized protein LOC109805304 isoform X2 [Cajanus cajan]|uniref:uncharacterized protein LOC109805304 isoform X2 n=1 Tax=Cajanus cajan TaxID=3821 RepID=UPI0010FB38E3|nr:uncharacterized protein LOC109805304 isoform X2 [Cajanus cajan]
MEPSQESIIQVKQELMVSPLSGENPLHRTAYFIQPCMEESLNLPHSTFFSGRAATITSNHAKLPLEVRYNGWHYPHEEWKTWVQQMQHKHEHVWIKAGIHQAIQASTFQIRRNDELILELAQRWCSKTNTFVFPWGEATITLEDMKVCWGYSVMGASIFSPLLSDEEKEVEQELTSVFRRFFKSKAKRADHTPWMKHFMNNESKVEHEGFLTLWLSSIYRDLSLLNNIIRTVTTVQLEVTLWAPFQLVQVWALERFPALQPLPSVIEQGQPMMAKWHKVKVFLKFTFDILRGGNDFVWRPYVNSPPLTLSNEEDMWVCNNPNFSDELEAFGRCLRVSELVGMKCLEQYCPNRVAMQFGMDQDIPGMLSHYNENPWISYCQPVMDSNLYIALSACHQPNVTSRYYRWLKQSYPVKEEDMHDYHVVSSSKYFVPLSSGKKEGEGSYGPPPGFSSQIKREQAKDFDEDGKLSVIDLSSGSSEDRCFDAEEVGRGRALSSPQYVVFPSSVEGARIDKDDGNGVIIQNSFCDGNGVSDIEGEDATLCVIDRASNLESRIGKVERVIAKLKAAKFGHKVQNIGVKAWP